MISSICKGGLRSGASAPCRRHLPACCRVLSCSLPGPDWLHMSGALESQLLGWQACIQLAGRFKLEAGSHQVLEARHHQWLLSQRCTSNVAGGESDQKLHTMQQVSQ